MYHEIIAPSFINTAITIFDTKAETVEPTQCSWHLHQEVELFLVTKGEKTFMVDDETIHMSCGDLIFVHGKAPHKTQTPPGSSGIMVQFLPNLQPNKVEHDQYILKLSTQETAAYTLFPAGTAQNLALVGCINKISREYTGKKPFYETFIKAYVYELLDNLYRSKVLAAPSAHSTVSTTRLEPALAFIHAHYAETIRLKDISAIVHVNKSHFCQIFKNTMGVSFVDYLNYVRICNAQELLSSTNLSITEIAGAVGFSSVAYFIKIFKKYRFTTPALYRKMLKRDT